jgi:hypothetical protein
MSSDLKDVVEESEVIVVSKSSPEFADALASQHDSKLILDLVHMPLTGLADGARYEGICW